MAGARFDTYFGGKVYSVGGGGYESGYGGVFQVIFGGEVVSDNDSSDRKYFKGGVWDVVRGIGAEVGRDIDGKVVSGDDG